MPTRQKGTRIQHRREFKAFHHQCMYTYTLHKYIFSKYVLNYFSEFVLIFETDTHFEDNSVPIIIDLTSEQEQTDKLSEENIQNSNTSQTNETPPIDLNENEKMIIQKQQADDSNEHLSTIVNMSEPTLNEIEFKTNTPSKKEMSMENHKMVSANFRYSNGIRMPPKKQIKLTE